MSEDAAVYKVIRTRHKRVMLEKVIEKKVCDYAKQHGFLVYKFVSPTQAGVPDRILISPAGRVLFIEFKRKGQSATPLQLKKHAELEKHYMTVYVVDEVAYGLSIINGILYDETHTLTS